MKTVSVLILPALYILFLFPDLHSQSFKLIESNQDYLIARIDFGNTYSVVDTLIDGKIFQKIKGRDDLFRNPGEPWLPVYLLNIGIPFSSQPEVKIISKEQTTFRNKLIIPFPQNDPSFESQDVGLLNKDIYSNNQLFPPAEAELDQSIIFRYARVFGLKVSPFQYNPVTRDLVYNKSVTLKVDFNNNYTSGFTSYTDAMTDEFLKSSVVNYDAAKNFTGKNVSESLAGSQSGYWYNPNKNYYKLYVKEEGVYRVTYEELISAGVPLGTSTKNSKLELFCNGLPVPIDVIDEGDSIFNAGDYFQFVGQPASPSPNVKMNIYNLTNVYWFSYESDSSGYFYKPKNGYPQSYSKTYYASRHTVHFEEDSIYERLGYSNNSNIDHWFWGKATAQNNQSTGSFEHHFDGFENHILDSHWVNLKVAMHGLTNSQWCNTDHKAFISITDQPIGNIEWDGQQERIFNKNFYVSDDSIHIFPTGNRLNVKVTGEACVTGSDEIRINWYEFEYWRANRANVNHFSFKSPDFGSIRFWISSWFRSDIKIYLPDRAKVISNPLITSDNYVIFVDTTNTGNPYFCASQDYYLTVDSIRADVPSDLRNLSNGADYIIITHPLFSDLANTLADYRQNNFPDESIPSPRIEVVDVFQIYDEFSYGLLDPYALKNFVKYAFENWQSPAPSYIVLVGDMSYDYRALLQSSRPNFIPSIPYFAEQYGEAASDNLMVAVSGTDPAPDLAIGRLSMENVEEGSIIINKILNYPDDPSKPWKQDILLVSSGLSLEDEIQFGFNDANIALCQTYVAPQGFHCSKVFNFPSKPEHEPFQGGGPEIRAEINEGTVLLNYYGHGGGYQWDLVFLVDDIYLLENEGRLPVILSVTCYTAHFDNQNVFGEIFNEVEGKGSIGFYGSSGLTYWGVGKAINNYLFEDIFINRNYVMGKAILYSKNKVPSTGIYGSQIALLTYLGDPVLKLALPDKPDFVITSSDITLDPENPLLGDTISVKLNILNLGTVFPNDSVTVELEAGSADTSYQVGFYKLGSFGEKDSVYFTWVPDRGGLYRLTARVNETNSIPENDHSDNIATGYYIIFNISEPYILEPIDGFSTQNNKVDFVFADIGHYIKKELNTIIEIDTSFYFTNPIFNSGLLTPSNGQMKWSSPTLLPGIYFWRARIFDGIQYGNWGPIRSFTVMNNPKDGYFAHGKILETFGTYNIEYSDSSKSLILNTDPLPARPSQNTLLTHFLPDPELPDSLHLTALATDGTYLYFGNIWATAGSSGKSMIYKVGTGNNGTVQGQLYGSFSSFRDSIKNSMTYHSDGNIYVAVGMSHKLVRISIATELVDTIDVPSGLLRWDTSKPVDGPVYIASDGNYIYNLATKDSAGNYKYTLRTLDPVNNWQLVRPDFVLSGSSFEEGMTSFFVHGDYIYPTEYFDANFMRRIRLSDGFFEEEWVVMHPFPDNFQSYYAWCWDWQNDDIYAGVYRASGFEPKFSRFAGYYVDASGAITTKPVGPVAWWNSLEYDINNPSPTGTFRVDLLGQNSSTKSWDTLQTNIPANLPLNGIDADKYQNLRLSINFTDSTFNTIDPMEFRSLHLDYQTLPDAYFVRTDLEFEQDSLLQGYPVTMDFKSRNYGELSADSLHLNFYLNGLDSIIYNTKITIPPDSISNQISYVIETDELLFENVINVFGQQNKREYFYFNNLIDNSFFVARDSLRPHFTITFDGIEIINNDIVSSNPEVIITLVDNSPLPLDTSYFTIVHTYNKQSKILRFSSPDLEFSTSQDSLTRAMVTWTPTLEDGDHILEVLAKDASGNFFDSTSYRVKFSVFTVNDITDIYNYPNPFKDGTHFTFLLKGNEKPQEINIKIYTIAGRLIWDYDIPPSELNSNFNKIFWNGRDQDGDEISNGVYFYKVIAKFPDKTKTITQKLAKVK